MEPPAVEEFERLGFFYLGREYDVRVRTRLHRLLLYDSRDLVTHGACVGMTGSDKTDSCICLLEEEFESEIKSLKRSDPLKEPLQKVSIAPKKGGISIRLLALVWVHVQ